MFFLPFRAVETLIWRVYCSTVTGVAGRRPVLENKRQGRQEPAGDRYGSLLQTGIVAKFKKFSQFFERHPINYIIRNVVAEFGLHSSNFLREKRSSSPPGRFQTMICSKVSDQRNSKQAIHFKSANQASLSLVPAFGRQHC